MKPASQPALSAAGLRAGAARRAVVVLAVAALPVLAATGCSSATPRTINPASAARQISAQLTARYHVGSPQVSCPAGVPARPGRTFVCRATIAGQAVGLDATVTDGSGRFSVSPASPILVPASVAAQLTHEIGSRTGRPVTVQCPGGRVTVVPVHGTFACTATFRGEAGRTVVVTVVDSRGDFGFQLAPAS